MTLVSNAICANDRGPGAKARINAPSGESVAQDQTSPTVFCVFALASCGGGGSSSSSTSPGSQNLAANISGNTSATEAKVLTLDASGSVAPSGQSLTYSWSQVSGPEAEIDNAQAAIVAITIPELTQDQTAEFEVTVSNGTTSSSSSQVVTFKNVFTLPRLDALAGYEGAGEIIYNESSPLPVPFRIISRGIWLGPFSVIGQQNDGNEYFHSRFIAATDSYDQLLFSTSPLDFSFSAGSKIVESSLVPGFKGTLIADYATDEFLYFSADEPTIANADGSVTERPQTLRGSLSTENMCNSVATSPTTDFPDDVSSIATADGVELLHISEFASDAQLATQTNLVALPSISTSFAACHYGFAWRVFNKSAAAQFSTARTLVHDALVYNEATGEIFHFAESIDPTTNEVSYVEVARTALRLGATGPLEVIESQNSFGQLELLLSDKNENGQHRLAFIGLNEQRDIVSQVLEFTGEVPASSQLVHIGNEVSYMILAPQSPEAQLFIKSGFDQDLADYAGPYFLELGFGATEAFTIAAPRPLQSPPDITYPKLLVAFGGLGEIRIIETDNGN